MRSRQVVSTPAAAGQAPTTTTTAPRQPEASTSSLSAASATGSSRDYFATDKRPVILYDGVCNL